MTCRVLLAALQDHKLWLTCKVLGLTNDCSCKSSISNRRHRFLQELRQQLGASQARAAAAEEAATIARLEAAEARRDAESKAAAVAPGTPEVRLLCTFIGSTSSTAK